MNRVKQIYLRLSNGLNQEFIIVLFMLGFNILLVAPNLMPMLQEISPYDEVKYIISGAELLNLQVRDLAWGPLVAVVYAPLHLLFGHATSWFVIEAWAGRFVLFAGLWLSTYYLATQLRKYIHPFLISGVLFTSVVYFSVVENQSDALFVSLSALSLAKLISFYNTHRLRDVWIGSIFLGLCILTRVESIVLVVPYFLISVVIGFRSFKLTRILMASLLPIILVFSIFVIANSANAGRLDLGVESIRNRAYSSFQWNQPILTGGDLEQSYTESEAIFGSNQDNQGSVLQAIFKNPLNFISRIIANAKTIPDYFLSFYNKKLGPVLLIFCGWGFYSLIRKREYGLLGILLVWASQALVSLGFFSRHLVSQISYLPLIFGALGVAYYVRDEKSEFERLAVGLGFFALTIFGIWGKKPAFYASGLIMLSIFILNELLRSRQSEASSKNILGYMLIFAVGLLFHGQYNFPNFPEIGTSPMERAVYFLEDQLPAKSAIASSNPLPVMAANMGYIGLDAIINIESQQAFDEWVSENAIAAIYVEPGFYNRGEEYRIVFDETVGRSFDLAFTGDPGSIQIYFPE